MSDRGFMSMVKNMFTGKKVEPVTQHPSSAPRKVNFGVTTEKVETKTVTFKAEEKEKDDYCKEEKDQFEELPKEIPDQAFVDADDRYDKIDCKISFKDLQLPKDDVLPGQVIVIYQKKIVECKLKKNHYVPGQFILTNYKFIFRPSVQTFYDRSDYFKVPLGMIDKMQRKNDTNKNKQGLPKLTITLKDARQFKFKLPMVETLKRIADDMAKFAFSAHKRQFFAFRHYQNNKQLQDKWNGWKVYDPVKQFNRMGLFPSPHVEKVQSEFTSEFKYLDNTDGKICSTYPSLLVVPARISYDYIVRCSKFRSRQRLPALTYHLQYAPGKRSTLFRCSQTRTGVGKNRCLEDEMMLRLIGDPSQIKDQFKGPPNCKIYDARYYYAALGNMISGKGYERVQFYKNCQIQWLNIPNIHAVRDSFMQMRSAALGDQMKFWSGVADSGWYDYVFLILIGAKSIANSLLKGINCVVHCSDGWDRTSQLCALAQILIDPYYRTIQGFQVLIQKDWISFGHMFVQRLNQGVNNPGSQNKSQVFLQFLDCVSQLLHQFPLSFQFNQNYLIQILRQAHHHIFGTFLCDNQLQQVRCHIKSRTVSLWSYIEQHRDRFLNPYYKPEWTKHLDVSCAQKHFRLWKQCFLAYVQGFKDVYSIYSCEWTDENPGVIHGQLRRQNQLLKLKHQENDKIIKELQQQIEEAKARKQKKQKQQEQKN